MVLEAVSKAISDTLSPPFRKALLASVALTLLTLAALFVAVEAGLALLLAFPYPYVETAIAVVSGLGVLVLLAFLIAPVTALYAGLFLDSLAEKVERTRYPDDPPGAAQPFLTSLVTAAGFALVVVAVNLVAFPLVLLVGFGVAVFLVANGYLLGREYFTFAALRFHDHEVARQLRRRHALAVFAGGLVAATVLAVPVLNLATPLFATALMVHLFKAVECEERQPGGLLAA